MGFQGNLGQGVRHFTWIARSFCSLVEKLLFQPIKGHGKVDHGDLSGCRGTSLSCCLPFGPSLDAHFWEVVGVWHLRGHVEEEVFVVVHLRRELLQKATPAPTKAGYQQSTQNTIILVIRELA